MQLRRDAIDPVVRAKHDHSIARWSLIVDRRHPSCIFSTEDGQVSDGAGLACRSGAMHVLRVDAARLTACATPVVLCAWWRYRVQGPSAIACFGPVLVGAERGRPVHHRHCEEDRPQDGGEEGHGSLSGGVTGQPTQSRTTGRGTCIDSERIVLRDRGHQAVLELRDVFRAHGSVCLEEVQAHVLEFLDPHLHAEAAHFASELFHPLRLVEERWVCTSVHSA